MKLLIAHSAYQHRGGEEVCLEREAQALREEGLEVTVFQTPAQNPWHTATSALLAPWGLSHERTLEQMLPETTPDILHAHNLLPVLSPRVFRQAKRHGIKTVLTLHNYRPLCLNGLFMTPMYETCERCAGHGYMPGIFRGCYRNSRLQSIGLASHLMSQKEAYEAVDCFIAPSVFLRNKFIQYGFPENKITVQGHFLPFLPEESPDEPEPYVVYLGRLSEEKGVRWLLSAFSNTEGPLRLKIAGQGPLKDDVLAACRTGRVDYAGYVSDAAKEELIRRATAVIIPSECYENFPLAVLEANAWGVPAVVADHGGLHDIVTPGENGNRYPPRNLAAFQKILDTLWPPGRASELRKTTQQYARRRFGREAFIQKRLSLYDTLLKGATLS